MQNSVSMRNLIPLSSELSMSTCCTGEGASNQVPRAKLINSYQFASAGLYSYVTQG